MSSRSRRVILGWLLAGSVGAAVTSSPAASDDRAFVRTGPMNRAVFFLLDVGGSMALSAGDDVLSLGGDDPGSRLYMTKASLAEAWERFDGVSLALATFPNQDGLYVASKGETGDRVELRSEASEAECSGWEPNGDDRRDANGGGSLKWPTESPESGPLSVGDVVPFMPGAEGLGLLLRRLAPNLADGAGEADFGIADYFQSSSVDGRHPLADDGARPLVPWGSSSLGDALNDFEVWLDGWLEATRSAGEESCGRIDLVILAGPRQGCRGTPAAVADRLLTRHAVRSHVVAVGTVDPWFDVIAAAGGTESAYRAQDRAGLAVALEALLSAIEEEVGETRSQPLAAGATGDRTRVVHSSFVPLSGASTWQGRLDGYVRPVPLADREGARAPDRQRLCEGSIATGCRAWDAGEELLLQAPTRTEAIAGNFRIGPRADERRVYYRDREGRRRYLLPPAEPAEQAHLYGSGGMGLDASEAEFASLGRLVLERVLSVREGSAGRYVLGDSFHSQPVLIEPPRRFDYLAADSEGRLEMCGPRFDGAPEDRVPYGCFALRHSRRRRMLAIGSNDGQLHVFDAGFSGRDSDGPPSPDPGTGRELFAFAPRSALEPLRRSALEGVHRFSVDGTVSVDDFLTRGDHGTAREWRTALVGGLREGGSGYYALDVTQPDRLGPDGELLEAGYRPSCSEGGPGCELPSPFPGLPTLEGRPFPSLLWELEDASDEDGNGSPDLGQSWSRPATGRIRTSRGDRFVAVFGGGMDPELELSVDAAEPPMESWSGNFLYMVDLETGEILYKRALDRPLGEPRAAAVPSGPAVVDLDSDGYLDAIYVGTTAGYLFKVDLEGFGEIEAGSNRIGSAAWAPFPLFTTSGRPIFHAPSVLWVASTGWAALAFGTGDRRDLWSASGLEGRFYVLVDEGRGSDAALLDASSLETIEAGEPAQSGAGDLLTPALSAEQRAAGRVPGWELRLGMEERLLAPSVVAGGVLMFTTYVPRTPGVSPQCGGSGLVRSYAVLATNANGVAEESRFSETDQPALAPMVDVALSPAAGSGSADSTGGPGEDSACAGEMVEELRTRLIAQLHPSGCVPSRRSLEVTALDSSSEQACIVSLPICVLRRDWRQE